MAFETYFITKKYKLSLQKDLFEESLNDNVKDLLRRVAKEKNNYQWDDFFFIIVWNDRINNWNKNIPFLSTQNSKKAILKYMALLELKELDLIGTTSFVFRYCKICSFILIFEIGNSNSFRLEEFVKDGIIIIKIILPTDAQYLDSRIDITRIPHKPLEQLNSEIELLQMEEGEILQIDENIKNKLNSMLKLNIYSGVNEEYKKFIESFMSSLVRLFDVNDNTKEIEILQHLHSMLVMIYTLIKEIDKNKKLVYIFHGSKGGDVSKTFIIPLGSICFMTSLSEIDHISLYINLFLLLSQNALIQKIYQYNLTLVRALRSAVAAIMARNMSHNIGSHILVYLKMERIIDLFLKIVSKNRINYKVLSQKIQELIKKINEIHQGKLNSFSFASIKDILDELERSLRSLSTETRWGIFEWIEDTKTFFGYLQHRMDFLAQVSTEWPKWTFSAYFMKDIMRNFLMQRHLLDGIAKSEGLRGFYYEWEEPYKEFLDCKSEKKEEKESGRIKIHVFNLSKIGDEKDNEIEKLWHNNQNSQQSIEKRKQQLNDPLVLLYSTDKDSKINIENDIPIAIPGGITGYHAFYVIIENIIRNSAKHGYAKNKENKGDLEIVIEFTDDLKEPHNYWRFRIYDNVNNKDETPEKDLVAFMNECLRHSLIKETGEIDKRHWGMAEMKIAAGYLQMRDIQDIGAEGDKITGSENDQDGSQEDFIIRAIESPIGTLGFEFKVKKPKEVGIVCYGGNK